MKNSGEINRERLRSYEKRIQSLPGIDQAVLSVEAVTEVSHLETIPVSDLIPSHHREMRPDDHGDCTPPFPVRSKEKGSHSLGLSISHGGSLIFQEKDTWTLERTLMNAAERSPDEGLLYINSDGSKDFQSYARLLDDAKRIVGGLRKFGLRPKDKVIFQFPNCRDFLSTFWGCVFGGIVPVPVSIPSTYSEMNSSLNKLVNTCYMMEKPFILTNRELSKAIKSGQKISENPDIQVVTVEELLANEPDAAMNENDPEDIALMMLTSGSTGKPKGVLLSHKNLISRSAGSVQRNEFSCNDISLNWMALDHVAGIIYFHLRDVFTGCRQIHVASHIILEDPLKWIDLIDQYRVTVTFAPNFAFGLVNRHEEEIKVKTWDLSSIRFLLNGGEAIVAKTARKFMELFIPHGLIDSAMCPAWGMSETSSGVVYSDRFSLENVNDADSFVEVGEPIPGVSLRIVDETGTVLEESKIGHLQVRGRTLMKGYYNNPEANAEAFTSDGWFDTGDLGLIQDGQLSITGRGKDEIIINGVNYYPHEIESAVETVEGVEVSFTAACAVRGSDDDTDQLAIFFSTSYQEWDRQMDLASRIRGSIVKEFALFPSYVIPVAKDKIPKTEIGKIQRSQLSKRFVEGEFDDLVRKTKAGNGLRDTVPDWFYRKVWLEANIDRGNNHGTDGHCVIFMDKLGLGTELARYLDKIDQKYIQVDIGKEFAWADENRFVISPCSLEHYDKLFAMLNEMSVPIDSVVHLWDYSAYRPVNDIAAIQDAQDKGIYSLLALIHALSKSWKVRKDIRLFVVSSQAQAASDGLLAYEKSTLPGFLKAAALDVPWLQCRHIDFELTAMDKQYLIDELQCPDVESEIAYRNGNRMRPYLSKITMLEEKPASLPLKNGGLYLIAGGFGGVGSYIAQRLMTDYRAKLLLVGRTELSDRPGLDRDDEQQDRVAERMRVYENLKSISRKTCGEFIYVPADISDYSQIEAAVSRAESKWGMALSGIFHLAGDLNIGRHWETAESHRIDSEGRDAYEEMFKAKVYGTWNLFQVIKRSPEAIFIGFSSVVSELGGATFGAYCTGNSFLDGCCRYHHNNLPQKVFSFNWSMWEGMGMNKDNPEYSRQAAFSMGNMMIEPENGWNSLLAGLCRKDPQFIVGLNGINPHICSRLDKEPESEKRLNVYVTTPSGGSLDDGLRKQVQLTLQDANYPLEIIEVNTIPVLENGSVDLKLLQQVGRNTAKAALESAAPATDAEKQIASIWKEALGVKKISVDINFFDLGGTSIQLAQVKGQIKAVFGRDISMVELFKFPTISSLAEFLASSTSDTLGSSLRKSEGRAAERRDKMVNRRRSGKRQSDKRKKR